MNVKKKIIIHVVGVLIISATCFFSGYFYRSYRYRLDGESVRDNLELLEGQGDTIDSLENGLTGVVTEIDDVTEGLEEITTGLENNSKSASNISSGLGEVEDGLSTDRERIQAVIDRLREYRETSEDMADSESSN